MSSYIVELEAHDGNGVVTLRYASQTIVTGPGDPVPNTIYDGRILDAGQMQRAIFGGTGRPGASDVSYGFLELNNGDRGLDRLKDYAFDGRPIRIYRAAPGQSLVGRTLLFRGSMKGLRSSNGWESLELQIKDRQAELNEPLLTATYAGTTLSPDKTVEGNEDLKGKIKPGAWGAPKQVSLQLVNAYDYLWQACVNPVRSIQLYDGGLPLRNAGDYPTIATLMAASMTAGSYATCLARGLVRPKSYMASAFTADIVEGTERSAARVAQRMLTHFGLTAADLDLASFDALHAAFPAEVEMYVDGEATAASSVQAVLDSVFATIVATLDGRFRVLALKEPDAAASVATFTLRDIAAEGSDIQINVSESADGSPVPPWQVTLDYGRLYQTFRKADLAGAVQSDPVKVAYFEKATRRETAEAPAVKARHLLSRPVNFETQLVQQSAAKTEAGRRLALLSRQRDRPSLSILSDVGEAADLGDTVILRVPMFGWDAGKAFRVLGRSDDFDEQTVTLDLWG